MNVFDWLSNMDVPVIDKFDVVEVRFKGGYKEYFRNSENLDLTTGDAIVVDVPNGHHIDMFLCKESLFVCKCKRKKSRMMKV